MTDPLANLLDTYETERTMYTSALKRNLVTLAMLAEHVPSGVMREYWRKSLRETQATLDWTTCQLGGHDDG